MTIIITGVPREANDPTGPCPTRKDIDDWYLQQTGQDGNRIQLTLFVEALTAIQNRDLDDELSYFRLAGIHSAPWADWDNVEARPFDPKDPENERRGFCVHDKYTFPTWHRVYLALFEQVIYKAMGDFINTYVPCEEKDKWKKEAKQWRLPYWDFARFPQHQLDGPEADELRLPILAMIPRVMVTDFTDGVKMKGKPNPLYRFLMKTPMGKLQYPYQITEQKADGVPLPFDKCQSTTKYGLLDGYNEDVWVDGGQNCLRVNLALNEHPWYQNLQGWESIPTLQDMTLRLLTTPLNWEGFSSTRDFPRNEPQPRGCMNIEGIHNNVHNWVGGFMFRRPGQHKLKLWGVGHMGNVPVAAFDPIFWLHHCNIDRLTAIWQSLNPEKWFDGYSYPLRNDDLKPFHRANNEFFKSDNYVRFWRNFNYDYEITQTPDDRVDRLRNAADVEDDVKRLYGQRIAHVYKDNKMDYVLNIKYKRHALNGNPFQINVFFGEVDGRDFYDSRSKNFVGSVFNFSASIEYSHCGNCIQGQKDDFWSASQIPATLAAHYYRDKFKGDPRPQYVVVNSQGQAVDLGDQVQVTLHKAEIHGDQKGKYTKVADGEPAKVEKGYHAEDIDRSTSPSSISSASTSPLIMVVRDD